MKDFKDFKNKSYRAKIGDIVTKVVSGNSPSTNRKRCKPTKYMITGFRGEHYFEVVSLDSKKDKRVVYFNHFLETKLNFKNDVRMQMGVFARLPITHLGAERIVCQCCGKVENAEDIKIYSIANGYKCRQCGEIVTTIPIIVQKNLNQILNRICGRYFNTKEHCIEMIEDILSDPYR